MKKRRKQYLIEFFHGCFYKRTVLYISKVARKQNKLVILKNRIIHTSRIINSYRVAIILHEISHYNFQ